MKTAAIVLNICGFALSVSGSCLAMWGILQQVNGYLAFKAQVRTFVESAYRIGRKFLLEGRQEAYRQMSASVNEQRAEDRGMSMLGFYAIFVGFLLQLGASGLLFAAALIDHL
jgi:hypothetical protein